MDPVVGHEKNYKFLAQVFNGGKLGQAYLLVGSQAVGKTTFTKQFIKYILCTNKNKRPCLECSECKQFEFGNNADVFWIKRAPEKHEITIDQIREVKSFTNLFSLSDNYRVVVIEAAEDLNLESGNALLKVLEEPLGKTIFFIICHDASKILPTLRSRCFILHFGLVPAESIKDLLKQHGASATRASDIAQQAGGRPGVALSLLADEELETWNKKTAQKFIEILKGGDVWGAMQLFIEDEFKDDKENNLKPWKRGQMVLGVWLTVSRDLILAKLGLNSLIRYQDAKNDLELIGRGRKLLSLINIIRHLVLAKRKLEANAHLKLTFEWLIITIPRL